MRDAIVIGCGIMGATIAAALRSIKADVLTLDDARPNSGTAPSGGHLKPSWFGGLKKAEYEPAMELLDNVWGLISEEFVMHPLTMKATIYRVDTDKVLSAPRLSKRVTGLQHLDNFPLVHLEGGMIERCRLLVIATGVWANELLDNTSVPCVLGMRAKQGVSFRIPGTVKEPFVKPWAPYKQIVAHQQSPNEVWVGDGTAVLRENWDVERTSMCLSRCQRALGRATAPNRILTGYRPYCYSARPCLLKELGPRAWIATGAGKMGTIAAGWAARRILDAVS